MGDTFVLTTIVACEVGFWVLVLGGLTLRYVVRWQRASTVVLLLVPVVDLVLVAAVAVDLHRGGEVSFAHQAAGIYLGFTVVFGHSTISWLDVRFAHRFAGGPPPQAAPRSSSERYRREVRAFVKWLGAAAIALVITFGLALTVADDAQARDLRGIVQPLAVITIGWLLFGPVWVRSQAREGNRS